MKSKKGSLSIYITFIFLAVIIIVVAAVMAPFGVLFNTEMYAVGDDIIMDANESISQISDSGVRNSIYDMITSAKEAEINNIEINSNIFQYSWVFVIILTLVVVFLYTRRISEIQQGFL